MSNTSTVLTELRRAWLTSGLTQEEIAGRIGMPRPAVTRALSGKHMPTLETLERLAGALGLDVALVPRKEGLCGVCST